MTLRYGDPEEVGMSSSRVRHLAQLARNWYEQGIAPSLVLVAARRGVIVLHEALGHLAPDPDAPPVALDTIFPLASVTKPITATAAMALVEDGILSLDRPVAEYVPEFTGEGKDAVMVHHLLTHTSGLRDEDLDAHARARKGTVALPRPEENQHPLIHEYLLLRVDAPLWKRPGVEMSYCGYGYNLLGDIVRRVTGQSLAGFARERIFAPLGMQGTSYTLPDGMVDRAVRRAPGDVFTTGFGSREFSPAPWGDSGAFSTAPDLARFGQMFLDRGAGEHGRVLSPASAAAMMRNQIPGISAYAGEEFFREASWSFGWGVHRDVSFWRSGTLHSPAAIWHNGWGGVYMWVDPVYELVGVYCSVEAQPLISPAHIWNADLYINALTAAVEDA